MIDDLQNYYSNVMASTSVVNIDDLSHSCIQGRTSSSECKLLEIKR